MENFITVVSTLIGGAWQLLQIQVPGFPFTYAELTLACGLGSAALAVAKAYISASGSASVGRNTRNPKISEERKNDIK